MKKLLSVVTAAAMMLSLAACGATADTSAPAGDAAGTATAEPADDAGASEAGGDADTGDAAEPAESYRIAVVQLVTHESLDMIHDAIVAEFEAKEAELGIDIEIVDFNGQADPSLLNQIGAQIMSDADGYDAIVPIASLAATTMQTAAEGQIPVIYSAVSYPETSDLVGLENVTGTSDALDTELIMDMMMAVVPDATKIGLLYSDSEDSSQVPIAEAEAYLDAKNIAYVERTSPDSAGVPDAVAALIADGVDAVFTPTDNTIMVQAAHAGGEFANAGIFYFAGADTFTMAGGFASCSVDYKALGAATADMTVDILQGGDVPEYQILPSDQIYVNTDVAAQLDADYSVLSTVTDYPIIEVTTTAE